MPIALEPNEICEIVLEIDKNKPRETQPRFLYKYLTCRQSKELSRFYDSLRGLSKDTSISGEQLTDKIIEKASTKLVGWCNIINEQGEQIPFENSKFEDIITPSEAQELITSLIYQVPSLEDKKKYTLPSESNSDSSVKTAEGQTNASADPQNKDQ